MKFRKGPFGVPMMSSDDIERASERFLGRVAPQTLVAPEALSVHDVIVLLTRDNQCTLLPQKDLGSTKEGDKILGEFNHRTKSITIDSSLRPDDPQYVFTLAHELGHFYLHGKVDFKALTGSEDDTIADAFSDLVTKRIQGSKPRSRIEWQANRFAACILMPRRTVKISVVQFQMASGSGRRYGSVWLDHQPSNVRAYLDIVTQVSKFYGVPKAVVKFRLKELKIVRTDQTNTPSRISDLLGEALRDLYRREAV